MLFHLVVGACFSPAYADDPQSLEDNKKVLTESVNLILIALEDGHKPAALQARQNLADQLNNLGDSCNNCHKEDEYPNERISGKATQQNLETLEKSIKEERVKDSQMLMAEIAATVCTRCDNTHQIVYDLRNALLPEE